MSTWKKLVAGFMLVVATMFFVTVAPSANAGVNPPMPEECITMLTTDGAVVTATPINSCYEALQLGVFSTSLEVMWDYNPDTFVETFRKSLPQTLVTTVDAAPGIGQTVSYTLSCDVIYQIDVSEGAWDWPATIIHPWVPGWEENVVNGNFFERTSGCEEETTTTTTTTVPTDIHTAVTLNPPPPPAKAPVPQPVVVQPQFTG